MENNIKAPSIKVAINNAEPLYSYQRNTISDAFRCPVRDTYGMAEFVCAASECENGNLHFWPEVGYTEVLDDKDDREIAQGETGRLVCTGLLNSVMPLIRYEVGDRGYILNGSTLCECSRNLPILGGIDGRSDDVIITRDGRRIGRLDPVFKAEFPIREAQIIQEDIDLIKVKLVVANGYKREVGEKIVSGIRDRVGDIEINLELVDKIPRTNNGKFRAVISKLNHQID